MTPIEPHKLQSEDEVDAYLSDLFKGGKTISLEEINSRATTFIDDPLLRQYFVQHAQNFIQS